MRLDVKRKLFARSERVKSVDFHPTEPWVLAALYSGKTLVWNYVSQELVKTFEVTELPVRCARFVARKQWIVTGSDDTFMRVFNYNTMDKLRTFEAHQDYIRSLAVHPTAPFVLSASDDMTIKLWDWERGWQNTMIFEAHNHYVMQVVFNPRDPNTFASASLDRTVRVWGLNSIVPHFTLDGHEKGVNTLEYFQGGDKPYLITGSDDRLVKVWDYQHKTVVQTLEGHTHNVSHVSYHPQLQVIITGSEDGTVRLWSANTFRLEKALNYGMERVWSMSVLKGTNKLAIGYDEGTVMVKLASESPALSMDPTGKIIWARGTEVQSVNVKSASDVDGERLSLMTKELGTAEFYPSSMQHSPNGRFVAVCGDGEYVIYTALALKNKSYGAALDFVWTSAGEYAVRETSQKIKVFKNFAERRQFRPPFATEGLSGGFCMGVRAANFICFYDWDECRLIQRIDVTPTAIYWTDNGEFVTIACESSFFVLRYHREKVARAFETGDGYSEDEGVEGSFEVLHEIGERVRSAQWVGDCFIYANAASRLNYCVGAEVVTVANMDSKRHLLGYIPKENKLYVSDKNLAVYSYTLHMSIINYQTAVLRGDLDAARAIFSKIPEEAHLRIAQFLEAQGEREEALAVSNDADHRFDLAVALGKLELALEIAKAADQEQKWKQLGDLALARGDLRLAETCFTDANDHGGLLLIYFATGNADGMQRLAEQSVEGGKNNVAFLCSFLLRRIEDCIELLCATDRVPEAAFLARTYAPSQLPHVVSLWRDDLRKVNARAADSLADPAEYPNLFPDLLYAVRAEQDEKSARRAGLPRAADYPAHAADLHRDLIAALKEQGEDAIRDVRFGNIVGGGSGDGGDKNDDEAAAATTAAAPPAAASPQQSLNTAQPLAANLPGALEPATTTQPLASNLPGALEPATTTQPLAANLPGALEPATTTQPLAANLPGALEPATTTQPLAANLPGALEPATSPTPLAANLPGALEPATTTQPLAANLPGALEPATSPTPLAANLPGALEPASTARPLAANLPGALQPASTVTSSAPTTPAAAAALDDDAVLDDWD